MNVTLLVLYIIILAFFVISLIKKRRKPIKLIIYTIQLLMFVYILFGLPVVKEKIRITIYNPYHKYLNDSLVKVFEDSLRRMGIEYKYVDKPDTLYPTIFIDAPYHYEMDIPLSGEECGISIKSAGKDNKGFYIDWIIISNRDSIYGYIVKNNNDTLCYGNLYGKEGRLYKNDKKLQILIDDIIKENNEIMFNDIDIVEDTFIIVSHFLNPSARIVKDILNNNTRYLFKSDKGYFIMKNGRVERMDINKWKKHKCYKYIIIGEIKFPYKGVKIDDDLWSRIIEGKEVYDLRNIYSLRKETAVDDTLLIKDYKRIKELNRLIGINKLKMKNINELKDFLNSRFIIKENMKLKIYLLFVIVLLMIVAAFV